MRKRGGTVTSGAFSHCVTGGGYRFLVIRVKALLFFVIIICINVHDVVACCLDLKKKILGSLTKIRSCAIFGWFNRFDNLQIVKLAGRRQTT